MESILSGGMGPSEDDFLPDEILIQRHWTRWMYTTCCYLSSLDSRIEQEGEQKQLEEMRKKQEVQSKQQFKSVHDIQSPNPGNQ